MKKIHVTYEFRAESKQKILSLLKELTSNAGITPIDIVEGDKHYPTLTKEWTENQLRNIFNE